MHVGVCRFARVVLSFIAIGVGAHALAAQAGDASIVVRQSDREIAALSGFALVEPHVAVSPGNPDHIVVGAIAAPPAGRAEGWTCLVLSSQDGGGTWVTTHFEVNRCIDPWVAFTDDGILVTAVELDTVRPPAFRLVSWRSEDGGRTWGPRQVIGSPHDHSIIVRSPRGDLWLTSRRDRMSNTGQSRRAIYIGRSTDAGRTFQDVGELIPNNLDQNATGLAVQDSTVFVSYWDFARPADGAGSNALTRGRTWMIRSHDAGQSFSEPMLITDECASGSAEGTFPGYPWLANAPDASPFAGRLYHACVRPGLDGVAVTHSADGGEHWSDPVRVDGGPVDSDVRTPMIAVNDDGVVGVAWYDRRDDRARRCQHTWFTASTDGGESFRSPVRVSTAPSCPLDGDNNWVATSWPMGGDYSSLAVSPDGAFILVWADSRGSRFTLRMVVLGVR